MLTLGLWINVGEGRPWQIGNVAVPNEYVGRAIRDAIRIPDNVPLVVSPVEEVAKIYSLEEVQFLLDGLTNRIRALEARSNERAALPAIGGKPKAVSPKEAERAKKREQVQRFSREMRILSKSPVRPVAAAALAAKARSADSRLGEPTDDEGTVPPTARGSESFKAEDARPISSAAAAALASEAGQGRAKEQPQRVGRRTSALMRYLRLRRPDG